MLPLLSAPHYNLSSFINRPVAACWQSVSTTLPLFPENSKLWHEPNFLSFCRSSHPPLLAHATPSFQLSVPKRFPSKIFRDHTWPWLRQVNHTCTLSLTTICLQVPILLTPFTGDPKSFFMSRACNLLAGSSLPIILKLPGDNASGCELTLTFWWSPSQPLL